MNKTLFSLALLSYNWDNNKKDIIDCYIPLVCSTIKTNNYSKITREQLAIGLTENYGIEIPLGAIEGIIKRMVKYAIIDRASGENSVISEKLNEYAKSNHRDELNLAFKVLVSDIIKYAKDNFNRTLLAEEVEAGLINFLKEHDLDILFAGDNGITVLPKVPDDRKVKYLIAKFITILQNDDPKKFATVVKLAQGYTIAALITYKDLQNYSGTLADVEVFLDAPIIFSLIGLNGESNLKLIQELVDILKTNDAKLRIFEINYIEVVKTLQDAIKRLQTKKFDIAISSRVLRTAVRENLSAQELQIKLNQLDSILEKHQIKKTVTPSLKESEWKYQIDEIKLEKSIKDLYKRFENKKIPWYKLNQIERDIETISSVYKIRRNTQVTSLKNSKAILLTSNDIIAYAAKKYDHEYKYAIPVCVTDVFLSTVLWANYPIKGESLNIKQLISECYDIIELDNRLLNKFYEDINRLHQENQITTEQFYLLNASNITYSILEQKTLNDIEEYTDKTPKEILEDLQHRINADLLAEKAKLSNIDANLLKLANFLGKSLFFVIGFLTMVVIIILKAQNPKLNKDWVEGIGWTISAFFGIFGILRWMELIPTKTKIETGLTNFVFNKLKNVLNKEK